MATVGAVAIDIFGDRATSEDIPESVASQVGNSMDINPNISSHSQKRAAIFNLNTSWLLRTSWICFRAGWVMTAVHTIFDYLDFSSDNDRQVARHLSRLGGGRPPSLEALKGTDEEEYAKALSFTQALFDSYDDCEGANEPDLQVALAATLIMYLPNFVELLLDHPQKSFGTSEEDCSEKHKFVKWMIAAGRVAQISDNNRFDSCETVERND